MEGVPHKVVMLLLPVSQVWDEAKRPERGELRIVLTPQRKDGIYVSCDKQKCISRLFFINPGL